MSDALKQAIRDSGYFDVFEPPAKVRHEAEIRRTIDAAGQIDPAAAKPFRSKEKVTWTTIDGRAQRTAAAGTMVLMWAHASTAPSTGPCVIQYTLETRTQGATPLPVTVRIEQGQTIGEVDLAQPIPAGAYLNPTVTSAGGASGVSTGIFIEVG